MCPPMIAARKLSGFSQWFLLLAALPHLLDAQTAVTLATSPNPSVFGAPVVLTATVTPSNATGRVTFYDGVTLLGTKPLSAGTASISTILLPAGTRRLAAFYNGGGNYVSSLSNVVVQRVSAVAGGGFLVQSPLSVSPATPISVAVGDFNGDGKADFVFTGGPGSGTVAVVLGRGDGSFQTPLSYTVGKNPRFVAVGDFDGDGIPDLAVSGAPLNILLGNGDGTFRQGASYPAPALPISVADLNGDGKADLVVSNTIWIGNGDGTFSQSLAGLTPPGGTAGALESLVVDINGDNQADIILLALQCFTIAVPPANGTYCSENLFSYLGNGDGTFQPPVALPAVSIYGFVVGDFNGDGKPDLAFWDVSSFVTVLLGAGDGTFGYPQITIAQVEDGATVTTGDFNGDGITDLAVANPDNTVFILRGNGDGTFQQLAGVVDPGSYDALAVADFNGDGRADLVIANAAFGSMSLLLGTAPGAGFQLTATGGAPQSARTGAAFPLPLEVTLRNNGIPVSGATVTFAAPGHSGYGTAVFLNASAVTNASGVAGVTAIASENPGSYVVTATSQGLIAAFSLTNTGTYLGNLTPLGTPQSATVGTAFPRALQVSVKDNAGNPVSGVTVRFTVPASGASALLSSATAVTNASGVVSVTATANGNAGGYILTASVGSGTGTLSTQFSLVNLVGGGVSNLALGKTAAQSSTLPGYPTAGAPSAVDGGMDGSFFSGSVTATNLDSNAWWQVDLGSSATVNSIVIWNRTDCCGSRLNDYWVFISDTPFLPTDTPLTLQNRPGTFSSHQTSAPNPSTTIAAGGAQGRYVRVQLTGANYLSLAEVQVLGTGGAPLPTNLALGKAATQSSTLPGYPTAGAGGAVDGGTDGSFFNGSVTATNLDSNAWWQVDLGSSATVNSIVIWNRTDCCGSRLNDYWVFISDTPFLPTDTPLTLQNRFGTFSSHQTAAPNPSITIAAGGAPGRYVRVQLTNANYLSLAEVQVMGTGGAPPPTNLALGKAATQSSIYPGSSPATAVDGNTDGYFGDRSVTATNADLNAWWQVDLGASAAVNSIVVWNRTDCCGSRLNDYWVFVSDTPFSPTDTPLTLQNRVGTWSSHQTTAPNPSANIAAVAQGRYVRVQLTGTNYLSLAEVQVFGQ